MKNQHGFAEKILSSSLNGIFIYDLNERTNVFINSSYTELTGYTLQDLDRIKSPGFITLFHPEDQPKVTAYIQAIGQAADDEIFEIECRFKTANRGWIWCWSRSTVFERADDGTVRQILGTFMDIDERKLAEENLRESEKKAREQAARLEATLDAAPVMIWTAHDSESRVITGNRAARELSKIDDRANLSKTGPAPELLAHYRLYKDGRELAPEEMPIQIVAKSGRELREYSLTFVLESGAEYLLHGNITPILDAEGKPSGAVAAFMDVTERKRMEEELRKSRDDLESLILKRTEELVAANQDLSEKAEIIDLAHDAIIGCDPENNIIFWNRGAQETYGFTHEEALGRVSSQLLKTASPIPIKDIRKTVLEKGEWKGELKHTKSNGERIIVESRWASHLDKERKAAGYLQVNRDITSRKIMEDEFRKVNRAFRTLSECNQAMVRETEEMELLQKICRIVVDVGGYRMAWVGFAENDENKTVMPVASAGYDRGYLAHAEITWADTEKGRGPTGSAIRTGKIVACQNALLNPAYKPWLSEGSIRGYASSIALPLSVDKKIIGALTIYASEPDAFDEAEGGLLSNLAENLAYGIASIRVAEQRRQSVEELAVRAQQLEAINKELEDFAFVASHDLQEPLRKIQTFCDMTIKRCAPTLDAAGKEYLDRVIDSANRMRRLLEDLLAFSRITAKPPSFRKVELARTAQKAADVFEVSLREMGCTIEIEDLPVVEADESKIFQVFQNLIGNALKYRAGEKPRIKICGETDGQGTCEIRVIDNGIGFDQQFAERIFKPFQRLHSRRAYEGTGIGLAVCRKIVEWHGGNIRAESEEGKGSIFIFRLPEKHRARDRIQ